MIRFINKLFITMLMVTLSWGCGDKLYADAPASSETGSDNNPGGDGDADTGSNSDTDADTDTDTDTDSDGDADTDTDADADTDTDTDVDSDTDTDADSDTDTDSDTDADGDTDVDTDSSPDGDTDGDTDADTKSDTIADSDSEEVIPCPDAVCNTNPENRTCEDGQLGGYYLLNNLWGAGGTVETDGQCSWALCDTSDGVAWGTEFTWTSGDPIGVKSYAALILGWHWSGVDPSTGLPRQLSSNPNIPTTWSFEVTVDEEASLNVAYDLWFSDSSDVGGSTSPTDEVMVWLFSHNKDDPIGEYQDSVTIAETDWDVYSGANGGTQVYSYIRVPTAYCDELNLMDFLNDLIDRGWMDPAKYLIGIEAGPEVVMGTGQVITKRYSCRVE